jgi:hypothetical protein
MLEGGIFFSGSFLVSDSATGGSNLFTDIFFDRKPRTSVISFSNLFCFEIDTSVSTVLAGIGTNEGFGFSFPSSRIDCLSSENASEMESEEVEGNIEL